MPFVRLLHVEEQENVAAHLTPRILNLLRRSNTSPDHPDGDSGIELSYKVQLIASQPAGACDNK